MTLISGKYSLPGLPIAISSPSTTIVSVSFGIAPYDTCVLPIKPPLAPMLSKSAANIPRGEGWVYEPKWDGFRAIAFVDQKRGAPDIFLCSRNGQPLQRYFPELVEALARAVPAGSVIDGEIIVATRGGLDFDALSQRIHPAESRVRRLAQETPSALVAFDALAVDGKDIRKQLLHRPPQGAQEAPP